MYFSLHYLFYTVPLVILKHLHSPDTVVAEVDPYQVPLPADGDMVAGKDTVVVVVVDEDIVVVVDVEVDIAAWKLYKFH